MPAIMTPEAASEHLDFDTEALPPSERMARYRELYGIGATITQTGPAPRATFKGWRLDRAILYDRRLNDIGHSRAPDRVDEFGLTHWTATMVLGGHMIFDLGAGPWQLSAGELLFIDTSRSGRNDSRDAHVATFSVARDRLEQLAGSLDRLHGVVVRRQDALLYGLFIRSLLEALPTLAPQTLITATTALGQLLRAALDQSGRSEGIAPAAREGGRLAALQALVDARLGDPAFGPDTATAEAGLSRATLYRLLQPHGGLATFIQHRRLEHLRSLLSNPAERRLIGTLIGVAGFRDEGQANRAFLARFGIRPGAYRAAVSRAEPDDQFRTWQQDLR